MVTRVSQSRTLIPFIAHTDGALARLLPGLPGDTASVVPPGNRFLITTAVPFRQLLRGRLHLPGPVLPVWEARVLRRCHASHVLGGQRKRQAPMTGVSTTPSKAAVEHQGKCRSWIQVAVGRCQRCWSASKKLYQSSAAALIPMQMCLRGENECCSG
jgi:hypothetical protein